MVEAYYFCGGGGLGKQQRTARPIGYRAAATEVPSAMSPRATPTRGCASSWRERRPGRSSATPRRAVRPTASTREMTAPV